MRGTIAGLMFILTLLIPVGALLIVGAYALFLAVQSQVPLLLVPVPLSIIGSVCWVERWQRMVAHKQRSGN